MRPAGQGEKYQYSNNNFKKAVKKRPKKKFVWTGKLLQKLSYWVTISPQKGLRNLVFFIKELAGVLPCFLTPVAVVSKLDHKILPDITELRNSVFATGRSSDLNQIIGREGNPFLLCHFLTETFLLFSEYRATRNMPIPPVSLSRRKNKSVF